MNKSNRYVACPQCERFVGRDNTEQAQKVATSHNNSMHSKQEVAIVITPTLEGIRKLMNHAQTTLTEDQLTQFQNFLLNQPHVMDNYFHWNGNFDEWHDEYSEFKQLKQIIKLTD